MLGKVWNVGENIQYEALKWSLKVYIITTSSNHYIKFYLFTFKKKKKNFDSALFFIYIFFNNLIFL